MGMFTDLIPQQLTPQEQKFTFEAVTKGLKWLMQTRKHHGLYRFKDCLHEQEINNQQVRRKRLKNTFRCKICFQKKLSDESDMVNLTWLKQTKEHYGLFRFKDCKHEQEISNSNVRTKRFSCQTCRKQKRKNEANQVNLNWLRQTRENYGLYRFNDCGHEQEIDNGAVKANRFACQTCEDTWFTKPSNVYVHSITLQGESIIKVGISQNVQHRIKGYGLPPEAVVQTVLVIPTKTGKEASDIETIVLAKFKPYRAKNIGHIMTKQGQTECFDASKLGEILDFTKAIAGVK
jgi:hypothetical protein